MRYAATMIAPGLYCDIRTFEKSTCLPFLSSLIFANFRFCRREIITQHVIDVENCFNVNVAVVLSKNGFVLAVVIADVLACQIIFVKVVFHAEDSIFYVERINIIIKSI